MDSFQSHTVTGFVPKNEKKRSERGSVSSSICCDSVGAEGRQERFMDEASKAARPLTVRHKCSACFKQYKKKEHLIAHMRVANHSVHQPQCGVCQKYCKSFESLREHLSGPLRKVFCAKIFSSRGCDLCMDVFGSSDALDMHKEKCRMCPLPALGHAQVNFLENNLESVDHAQLIAANHNNESPKAVAMDCEMVGGGSDGTLDICGRVCLIDEDENVIFHSYVIPQIPITNYRHEITGITEDNLKGARPLKQVREKIEEILHNGEAIWKIRLHGGKARILVGHSIEHDLYCLQMNYPDHLRRDTACYPPLMKTNLASHSLKYLVKTYLGNEIQSGVHDPYEDCVAAMRLYKKMRGQAHNLRRSGTLILNGMQYPTSLDDAWGQKELEKMSPEALFEISKPNYRCWCLDREPEPES
ncbi:uncharacterized protein [Aristolochia californica]|uniref:uncharacterized protein n=1 Tax=Aristolochia californica TaxID=171875 RepID=UPI0035E0DEE7